MADFTGKSDITRAEFSRDPQIRALTTGHWGDAEMTAIWNQTRPQKPASSHSPLFSALELSRGSVAHRSKANSNIKFIVVEAKGAEDFIKAKTNPIKYILFPLIYT